MFLTVSEYELPPEEVDRFASEVIDAMTEFWREVPGAIGATMGVDRVKGRAISVLYWRSREDVAAAEALMASSQTALGILVHARLVSRTRYEIAATRPGAAASPEQRPFFESG